MSGHRKLRETWYVVGEFHEPGPNGRRVPLLYEMGSESRARRAAELARHAGAEVFEVAPLSALVDRMRPKLPPQLATVQP